MTYNNQIEIVLFTNNKRRSEKAPHKTGTVEFPDGTKYEVALWNKVSKSGNVFEAGVLKLPDPKYQRDSAPSQPPAGQVNVDF